MRANWVKSVAIAAVLALLGSVVVDSPNRAEAYTAADFDPGYIVSDGVFFNSSSMNESQIQTFLQSQVPNCAPVSGVQCLPAYTTSSTSRPAATGGQCQAYQGAASESASRIIFKVAQACGINPQVLIVLLQKEQGLITARSPSESRYRIATGYGCPDTAACDAQFYGFYNQLYKAAWQFREYAIHSNSWRYRVGTIPVQYHPNAGCGAPAVNIRNVGTAALYNYTPYQPNPAALANLTGSGDACSSYGNRNFWVYFSNWFGSPVGAVNPVSALDTVTAGIGQVRVTGWAFDPDTSGSIGVHIYVGGAVQGTVANLSRPDVAAAYGIGDPHGYDVTIPVSSPGPTQVCAYAINEGPGANTFIGCRTTTVPGGSPIGVLDSVRGSGSIISVDGWAIDPDTVAPITVHLYVDSAISGYPANGVRADIGAAFPGYGAEHGYSAQFSAGPGQHTVCAFGLNVGAGTNTAYGCKSVTLASGIPRGTVDGISSTNPGIIDVAGWAFDPDTTAPIPVHIYVDASSAAYLADRTRADVGRAFPGIGDDHGFAESVAASAGRHTVCVYAINGAGAGGNPLLGCDVVVVG